jgi:hypothetical protein
VSGRRPGEGDRERVLDGQGTCCGVHLVWPNDDRLTRTYVNSRTYDGRFVKLLPNERVEAIEFETTIRDCVESRASRRR